MHDSASFEIKALLTLALLKSGTSAKDIQTAVGVASAARLMAAEEYAGLVRGEESRSDTNVTSIYDARHGEPATRKQEPLTDSTHSEIKALLSLLLLQHGASSKEILTTLRMAAAAAARMTDDEQAEPEQTADEEGKREPEKRAHTPKQALRNEQLAPIAKVVRAA